MKKISLLFISAFIMLQAVAQIQQPNSISPTGKRSWAGTDSAGVYTFVEQVAEFPGGDTELLRIIKEHLEYPKMEFDNHIQGTVLVRFIINENGSVSDVHVSKKVSPGLDKEAIRVVRNLPSFHPGRQQGKPVKVYYNLPVIFKLPQKK